MCYNNRRAIIGEEIPVGRVALLPQRRQRDFSNSMDTEDCPYSGRLCMGALALNSEIIEIILPEFPAG